MSVATLGVTGAAGPAASEFHAMLRRPWQRQPFAWLLGSWAAILATAGLGLALMLG